jgi:D-glycero-D-manno-heptose 1,7-bisphosphate phosphatase
LFDRDGTLVEDVPYNGDPSLVRPMPTAVEALRMVRARGIRTGLISNQSGVARGLLTLAEVDAVNDRVAELLGPFDVVRVCPHGDSDGCRCRKPAPGMIVDALAELGLPPSRAVMIGDIGADVLAGTAAGVRSILVPTGMTRSEEVAAAPEVAAVLIEAVRPLVGYGE